MDIKTTDRLEYTLSNILSNEWIIADEKNTPVLGGKATFDFGEAIKYVKRGLKVSRKGWNGKKQYIELATNISYSNAENDVVNVDHQSMGNKAIVFVGTSGHVIRRLVLYRLERKKKKLSRVLGFFNLLFLYRQYQNH